MTDLTNSYVQATGLLRARCLSVAIELETLIKFGDTADWVSDRMREAAEKLRTALQEAERLTALDPADQGQV